MFMALFLGTFLACVLSGSTAHDLVPAECDRALDLNCDVHNVSLLQVSFGFKNKEDKIPVAVNGVHFDADVGGPGPFSLGRNLENLMHVSTATRGSAVVFVLVLGVYASLCVWYQLTPCIQRKLEPEDNRRVHEWDMLKFILMTVVIFFHMQGFHVRNVDQMKLIWPFAFTMPTFVFISGIFSARVSKKSIIVTVVGLPCTLLLFDAFLAFITAMLPGGSVIQIGRTGVDWYLVCLIGWRLVIPCFFVAARHLHIWSVVPCAVVVIASWALWSGIGFDKIQVDATVSSNTRYQLQNEFHIPMPTNHIKLNISEMQRPFFTPYPWRLLVFYAPYFALGLSASPDQWLALFRDRRFCIAAFGSGVTYFSLMLASPAFTRWFDVNYLERREVGNLDGTSIHWPKSVLVNGLTFNTFLIFMRVFVQKLFLTFTAIGIFVPLMNLCKRWAPCTARFIEGCGARSSYPYLLHWVLFIVPGARTPYYLMQKQYLGLAPYGSNVVWPCLYLWLLAFVLNVLLSCEFTEVAFAWMFKCPVWAANWLSQASQK